MSKNHIYKTTVSWNGTLKGTINYGSYSRNHVISTENKPIIDASSDASFKGDIKRYNPEELLVASASSCHMLWYLHLCAIEGVVVLEYTDNASGIMLEEANGSGRFLEILLNPTVTVKDRSMAPKANELHHKANKMCFIANSCNFPIKHTPIIIVNEDKQ